MSYHKHLGRVPVKVSGPMPQFDCDIWWRADIKSYANYDPFAEFEQPSGSHDVIELRPYEVVKHTPKGVWVRPFMGGQRFILGRSTRQECVPTKELAMQDLAARKSMHATMAQKRADRAKWQFEVIDAAWKDMRA